MSWLRDHFYNLVFPAFEAAGKRTTEIGKPFDVKASPHAPERLPSELKKLWTLCQDHKIEWSYDTREINLYGGSSKYRETAQLHSKILRATLDSAVAALRAERCDRLFLGGRDVWTFAVLCEKRRIPYMFVPELSRPVADDPKVKAFLEARGFKGTELFLDTGFAGSIPRCLEQHFARPFKFRLMSQTDQHPLPKGFGTVPHGNGGLEIVKTGQPKPGWLQRRPNQLFPNRKKARGEALETEYLAKYWSRGSLLGAERIMCATDHEKWRHIHPGPVYRYKRQGTEYNGNGYGLTDGTRFEYVSEMDIGLAPGFVEWWLTLPERPDTMKPQTEIGQFFSDKRAIQRAAVLTSQLWRGIPFWKFKEEAKRQKPPKGNLVWDNNAATIYQVSTDASNVTYNSSAVSITSPTSSWVVSDATGTAMPYLATTTFTTG